MGENRKIYAALLGAGTVGSGVYVFWQECRKKIFRLNRSTAGDQKILVRNPGKVAGNPTGTIYR